MAFFEKENTVTIKVVCCSPDKIRDKLICKGGKTIKSFEIIVPEKTKPPPPPPPPKPPTSAIGYPPIREVPPPPPPPKPPTSAIGYPPIREVPPPENPDLGHRGPWHGGPCHHGYGIPHQRPSSYDGYVKLVPSYDESYGGWPSGCRCNRSYGCRCEYFTEENPACTIM